MIIWYTIIVGCYLRGIEMKKIIKENGEWILKEAKGKEEYIKDIVYLSKEDEKNIKKGKLVFDKKDVSKDSRNFRRYIVNVDGIDRYIVTAHSSTMYKSKNRIRDPKKTKYTYFISISNIEKSAYNDILIGSARGESDESDEKRKKLEDKMRKIMSVLLGGFDNPENIRIDSSISR